MRRNDQFCHSKLQKIAANIEALSAKASRTPDRFRLAGRLARNPGETEAVCEIIVAGMKNGDPFVRTLPETPDGFALVHCAMWNVSMPVRKDMWVDAHPDQPGQEWDGEDFVLMSVWRDNVRAVVKDCRQEVWLKMTANDYISRLIAGGMPEKLAEGIADWISEIRDWDTPSTEVVEEEKQ